jgi:hypothetical protein
MLPTKRPRLSQQQLDGGDYGPLLHQRGGDGRAAGRESRADRVLHVHSPTVNGLVPRASVTCQPFSFPRRGCPYCTLELTDALPFNVNVHVFVLLPPLEHAPDQIASRLFVTRSVIDVPAVKEAEPVVPTLTLIPVGVDVTRSPLRPVAVTVKLAACPGGFTVSVAVRVTPL